MRNEAQQGGWALPRPAKQIGIQALKKREERGRFGRDELGQPVQFTGTLQPWDQEIANVESNPQAE